MSVPTEITIAVVEAELVVVRGYADRHQLALDWQPKSLIVAIGGKHPANGDPVEIKADLAGYRAVAPAWTVTNPSNAGAFPKGGTAPNGKGSLFHGEGVICAHFNRLAYKSHGGPHDNWNGPDAWLQVREQVFAATLGEMLLQIMVHLNYSPGWK